MRLALMGQKVGHTVIIVLEQLSELDVLLKVADDMDGRCPPWACASSWPPRAPGRWAKSGGEKSKFGLSSAELVKLLDRLKALGRQDILKLVHFHLGSQITDIRYIQAGLEEIARFYVELLEGGISADLRGRGGRPRRGLRRVPLHPPGQHELHGAGVRQRRGVHPGHRLPGGRDPDAPPRSRSRAGPSPPTTRCCSST